MSPGPKLSVALPICSGEQDTIEGQEQKPLPKQPGNPGQEDGLVGNHAVGVMVDGEEATWGRR